MHTVSSDIDPSGMNGEEFIKALISDMLDEGTTLAAMRIAFADGDGYLVFSLLTEKEFNDTLSYESVELTSTKPLH